MIELKQLYADSLCSIVEFDKACFPADYWNENDWKELLADPRAIYYALVNDQKIVGNIFIYNWKGEKDYIKIMNIAKNAESCFRCNESARYAPLLRRNKSFQQSNAESL